MEQLKILDSILNVDDSTGAVFDVGLPRLYQFAHLPAAQMQRVLPVPRRIAVRETVAVRFHTAAKSFVSGLDPQTSMLIDKLIYDITKEFNMTTVINTHDMNSVMEIGENILYMYEGEREWIGNNKEIIFSKNQKLNQFIFASEFLRDAKDMRMLEEKGIIDNDRNMEDVMRDPEANLLMSDNLKKDKEE